MSARQVIHRFLVVFGIVVGGSFAYGGYLMHVRRMPAEGPVSSPLSNDAVGDLLQIAGRDLASKHVEQALVGYRKALAIAPKSLDVQLGVARGELMAGRESIAAQEYERVLLLDQNNIAALRQLALIYSHQHQTLNRSEQRYRDFL